MPAPVPTSLPALGIPRPGSGASRSAWSCAGTLHGVIDPHKLDMSHVTERKGSPYTLACTKNRANHERRLKEYAGDVKQTAPLAELAPAGSALSDIRTVCGQLREAVAVGERRVPARRG